MDSEAQCCGQNFLRFRNPAARRKPVVWRPCQTPLGGMRLAPGLHAPAISWVSRPTHTRGVSDRECVVTSVIKHSISQAQVIYEFSTYDHHVRRRDSQRAIGGLVGDG
jgi:hypothetical protein